MAGTISAGTASSTAARLRFMSAMRSTGLLAAPDRRRLRGRGHPGMGEVTDHDGIVALPIRARTAVDAPQAGAAIETPVELGLVVGAPRGNDETRRPAVGADPDVVDEERLLRGMVVVGDGRYIEEGRAHHIS